MKVTINLNDLLKKHKMTTIRLAELSGLSRQQISNIKNHNPRKIEYDSIAKLLIAFKCKPNDLFTITK